MIMLSRFKGKILDVSTEERDAFSAGILTSADALLPWFTAPCPSFTLGQSEAASNNLRTFQWQICFWFFSVINSCLCCTLDNQSSGASDWSDQLSAYIVIDYLIDDTIWLGVKRHPFCHISTITTKILYFIQWACLGVWLKQIITFFKQAFFCFTPFLNGVIRIILESQIPEQQEVTNQDGEQWMNIRKHPVY